MNTNKQVLTVNTEQARRIIALCWKAQGIARKSGIPVTTGVALVGPTGTAKSSIVKEVVAELQEKHPTAGFSYWMASLALMLDSGDLGCPVPDTKAGIMRYFTAGHWPFGKADAPSGWSMDGLLPAPPLIRHSERRCARRIGKEVCGYRNSWAAQYKDTTGPRMDTRGKGHTMKQIQIRKVTKMKRIMKRIGRWFGLIERRWWDDLDPDYDFWFLAVGFFFGVVLTLLIQAVAR